MAAHKNDISEELSTWRSGAYGQDVRGASISAFSKLKDEADSAVDAIYENKAAMESALASEKADRERALASEKADRESKDAVLNARMDTFTQLPAGSTSGDAELIDIRVGEDGTEYSTAGDAVRGQVSKLSESIVKMIDTENILLPKLEKKYVNDKTIFTSDGQIYDFPGWYCTEKFAVNGGERLYVLPFAIDWNSVDIKIFFYEEDDSYISGGAPNDYANNMAVVVPDGASYMMYAWYNQDHVGIFSFYLSRRADITLNKYKKLELSLPKFVHAFSDSISTNLQILGSYQDGFVEDFKSPEYIKIHKNGNADGVIGIWFYGTFTGDLLVYCPFEKSNEFSIYNANVQKVASGNRITDNLVIFEDITLNGRYFISSYFDPSSPIVNPTLEFIISDLNNIGNFYLKDLYDKYLQSQKESTIGKVLYLGDSITYLNQWIPFFEEITKPTKSVNIAVSGATWRDKEGTVYDGNPTSSDETNNVIGNQVEKIIRGKDETDIHYSHVADYDSFDVILISAGTNDGIYSQYKDIENENTIEEQFIVQGNIVPLENVNRKVFAGAIRYAYEKLHKLYPTTQIFICTPIQENYASDDTYNSIRDKGTLMKLICDRLSLAYIDTFKCGICNIYNYPNGVSGSEDLVDGIHPNANGGKKIGRFNGHEVLNKLWLIK